MDKTIQTIPVYKFSKKELDGFKEYLSKQVIDIPTNNLRNIYEKRILYEISYLRAEKYDSPENAEELKELQKTTKSKNVPRGIQNKNFDTLLKYHSKLFESPSEKPPYPALSVLDAVALLKELNQYICSWYKYVTTSVPLPVPWTFMPRFLSPLPDVRCVQHDPNLFFCYLLTRFKMGLVDREIKVFNKLTKSEYDAESVKLTLEQLRDALVEGDMKTYLEFTQEIAGGVPWNVGGVVAEINLIPEKCEGLKDLFDYMYLMYKTD